MTQKILPLPNLLLILLSTSNGWQPRRPVPNEQFRERLCILQGVVTVQSADLDDLVGAICLRLAPDGRATIPTEE